MTLTQSVQYRRASEDAWGPEPTRVIYALWLLLLVGYHTVL